MEIYVIRLAWRVKILLTLTPMGPNVLDQHCRRWRLRQYNFDLQISRWSFGFWYLLLDIYYCSLVSQIGAVLFLHGFVFTSLA